MKRAILSCDVERDHVRFLGESTKGITEGLPLLIDLLQEKEIPCDFYVDARVLPFVGTELQRARRFGGILGSHGLGHSPEYYSLRSRAWHRQMLDRVLVLWRESLGDVPRFFRAPNFSISDVGLAELAARHFIADSSVLPDRHVLKWRFIPLLDHRGAPREPYRPDGADFRRPGAMQLLEIPLTSNPLAPGQPLGLGNLRTFGLEKTIQAFRASTMDIVQFLIHPWELVDWSDERHLLPSWILHTSGKDITPLADLLDML